MAFGLGNLANGLLGNLSEQNNDNLEKEFGKYLLDGEIIERGFKLVRDFVLFTNIRIIDINKQGATGKKTSFESIYLMNIIDVSMETAGAGIDDSEIVITYLNNVKRRAHTESYGSRKFEFPKNADIVPLYRLLATLAYKNRIEINAEPGEIES